MRRRHQLRPDTFPFLAVLLCAMGSLILVLMEFDRRARSNARGRAEAVWQKQEQDKAELRARLRAAQLAELEKQRQTQAARLAAHQTEQSELRNAEQTLAAEERAVQGRIDAILRALQEGRQQVSLDQQQRQEKQQTAARLEQALGTQQQLVTKVRERLGAVRSQREQMTDELLALEESLKRLKEHRQRESKKWSIVPYVGKRGLSRRPLYVECARDKLIFYPDRATLSDYRLSQDRIREEVTRRGAEHRKNAPAGAPQENPYWLLLVRPDGVGTYYEFLAAVKALDLAYGYEFVEDSWDFDLSDPKNAPEPVEVATPLPTPTRPQPAALIRPPARGAGSNQPPGATGTPVAVGPGVPGNRETPGLPPLFVGSAPSRAAGEGTSGTATVSPPRNAGTTSRENPQEGPPPAPETTPPKPPRPEPPAPTSGQGEGAQGQGSSAPPEEVPTKTEDAKGKKGNANKGSRTPTAPPSRVLPEWVLVIECRPDGVLMSPSRDYVSLADLVNGSGGKRLAKKAAELIAWRRALVAAGDVPPRITVRFLVHKQALRTYHLTYPLLDALDAEKRAVFAAE